ncbi:MAG: hypothetical protein ACJ72K_06995 [Friedmanniella sp.]
MVGAAARGRAGSGPLLLAAVLILAGVVVTAVAGLLHPEGADANDHPAIFAVYAASRSWTAVHLGQFVGMAMIVFGLVALSVALDPPPGAGRWLSRMGVVAAGSALALYAVLQAVDGVALKQAVDAWASAGEAERTVRFAGAETVRWLEWAVRSYQSFLFGLALILIGGSIAVTAGRVPRAVGYLMALSGLCYLAQGWIIGTRGFSRANQLPTLLGIVLVLAWSLWLLVAAVRRRATAPQ